MVASRNKAGQLDEVPSDPGQLGPESGGQSGDAQGLPQTPDAADESVEGLADSGQAYEAGVVAGLEEAADHPEKPVRTHEDELRPAVIAPDTE